MMVLSNWVFPAACFAEEAAVAALAGIGDGKAVVTMPAVVTSEGRSRYLEERREAWLADRAYSHSLFWSTVENAPPVPLAAGVSDIIYRYYSCEE